MKRFIPLILVALFSCKPTLPTPPSHIIPMNKMRLVLADMHIAEAVAETKAQVGANEKNLVQEYDEQIFKNHAITREDFSRSFKWYEENPVLLNQFKRARSQSWKGKLIRLPTPHLLLLPLFNFPQLACGYCYFS